MVMDLSIVGKLTHNLCLFSGFGFSVLQTVFPFLFCCLAWRSASAAQDERSFSPVRKSLIEGHAYHTFSDEEEDLDSHHTFVNQQISSYQ
jgi:hypothetical protein